MDLDLTTINRPIKSMTESRHKRLKDIEKPGAKRRKVAAASNKDDTPQSPRIGDDALSPELVQPVVNGSNEKRQVQMLDIDTANPVVAYQGQIYSCNWLDLLGTTMFFSKPQQTTIEPQVSHNDLDLLGTSRIKLVGTAAKVTPNQQSASGKQPERPGQSLGTIRSSNAKTNADLRKQANFLDQLMTVKKNRGEVDNVRVAMNEKISAVVGGGNNVPTPAQRMEIDELNRRVVKGDANALRKLERMVLASGNDRATSPCGNPYAMHLNESANVQQENTLHGQIVDDTSAPNMPDQDPSFSVNLTSNIPHLQSSSIYPELHVPISNPENMYNDNG